MIKNNQLREFYIKMDFFLRLKMNKMYDTVKKTHKYVKTKLEKHRTLLS